MYSYILSTSLDSVYVYIPITTFLYFVIIVFYKRFTYAGGRNVNSI